MASPPQRQSRPAIAQKHRHELYAMVSNGDIQVAIAIEITEGQVVGGWPGCKRRAFGGNKAAFAVAEVHRKIAAAAIGNKQIVTAIMIQVGNENGLGVRPGGKVNRPLECQRGRRLGKRDRAQQRDG